MHCNVIVLHTAVGDLSLRYFIVAPNPAESGQGRSPDNEIYSPRTRCPARIVAFKLLIKQNRLKVLPNR